MAQETAERKRQIREWTQPMTGAMRGMLAGVLQGTQSIEQVFARVLQNIALAYAEKGLEIAVEWAENQIAMALATESTAAQQTAVMTEQAVMSIATAQVAASGAIAAYAAEAAAAAYASICAIPIIGPFIAPAFAAEAYAATMAWQAAVAVAERGWGEVPDDNMPTLLHKKEMVLPADIAVPLRAALAMPQFGLPAAMTAPAFAGPGSALRTIAPAPAAAAAPTPARGGDTYEVKIQATDAASVANLFQRNGRSLVAALHRQVANGATLSPRR
jgi:hypothetical protein